MQEDKCLKCIWYFDTAHRCLGASDQCENVSKDDCEDMYEAYIPITSSDD